MIPVVREDTVIHLEMLSNRLMDILQLEMRICTEWFMTPYSCNLDNI